MDIKELIWLTHGMEIQNILQAINNAEWSSREDFMDIVDIETSTLMAVIYVDDTFSEYDEGQIQSAVLVIIEDYIKVQYYQE